jgi:hypothetical protein
LVAEQGVGKKNEPLKVTLLHMESNEAPDLLKTSIFFKGALEDRAAKGPSSPVYRLLEKQLRKRSDKQLTRRLYLAVADHVTLVAGSGLYDDLVAAIFGCVFNLYIWFEERGWRWGEF